MTNPHTVPQTLARKFYDLSEADFDRFGQYAPRALWSSANTGWEELLKSDRILIVSDAGSGKTFECRQQQQRLWQKGEPAFYLDLSTLATTTIGEILSLEEAKRLEAWLRAPNETATFFLDSIDELSLSFGKFDQALKRLERAVEGKLGLIRTVITTRPVPIDRELIERHLPIPPPTIAAPTGEGFANIVLENAAAKSKDKDERKPWRQVALFPLNREQIGIFCATQDIVDPEKLLAEIYRRDVEQLPRDHKTS